MAVHSRSSRESEAVSPGTVSELAAAERALPAERSRPQHRAARVDAADSAFAAGGNRPPPADVGVSVECSGHRDDEGDGSVVAPRNERADGCGGR